MNQAEGEGEALGEELWSSGASTKTTSLEKLRLLGGRSRGKEARRGGTGHRRRTQCRGHSQAWGAGGNIPGLCDLLRAR